MEKKNDKNINCEYEILGFKVRFSPDVKDSSVDANAIMALVNAEAEKIRRDKPLLNQGQVATLVALKIAADKLMEQQEYRNNIAKFHLTAKEALQLIEEVTPLPS